MCLTKKENKKEIQIITGMYRLVQTVKIEHKKRKTQKNVFLKGKSIAKIIKSIQVRFNLKVNAFLNTSYSVTEKPKILWIKEI